MSPSPSWLSVPATSTSTTVQVTGTAGTAGTYTLAIEVSAGGCKYTVSRQFKVWSKLKSLVTTALAGKNPLNVAVAGTTISGGKPPYRCARYTGPGGGTQPSGVLFDVSDTTGCTLIGAPDNTNPPGLYGFMVTVSDSLNTSVDIPVTYTYGNCNDGKLTITPAVNKLPVFQAGSAYSWNVKINDIDAYQDNNRCTFQLFLLLGRGPLTSNSQLTCGGTEPICVECNSTNQYCSTFASSTTCPTTVTVEHFIRVRKHPVMRTDRPAFLTLIPEYNYTTNKSKKCHWEVLETP